MIPQISSIWKKEQLLCVWEVSLLQLPCCEYIAIKNLLEYFNMFHVRKHCCCPVLPRSHFLRKGHRQWHPGLLPRISCRRTSATLKAPRECGAGRHLQGGSKASLKAGTILLPRAPRFQFTERSRRQVQAGGWGGGGRPAILPLNAARSQVLGEPFKFPNVLTSKTPPTFCVESLAIFN